MTDGDDINRMTLTNVDNINLHRPDAHGGGRHQPQDAHEWGRHRPLRPDPHFSSILSLSTHHTTLQTFVPFISSVTITPFIWSFTSFSFFLHHNHHRFSTPSLFTSSLLFPVSIVDVAPFSSSHVTLHSFSLQF